MQLEILLHVLSEDLVFPGDDEIERS